MKVRPTYPVARLVAEKVEVHFAQHAAAARQQGHGDLAPLPDAEAVEALLNAAFWASLRREESYTPKISLALLPPERAGRPLRFQRPLPLGASALARLAPAVERPGIHLGVWREQGELRVWGATRFVPALSLVLEVVGPGLLVIKHRRGSGAAKFGNVAVLEGDQVKFVDEQGPDASERPPIVTSLLGADSTGGEPVNVLAQLAVSMRAHGRGGALLVVPAGSEAWRESVVRPVSYALVPTASEIADLMGQDPVERSRLEWREALRRAVDAVAGLTAVDGATIMSDRYELLAFGAKLGRRDGGTAVEAVALTEPIEGATTVVVDPTQLGGTRHLSAAQFAHDQHDAVALVASQDGRFTVFAWSPAREMVRAHRIEALLL